MACRAGPALRTWTRWGSRSSWGDGCWPLRSPDKVVDLGRLSHPDQRFTPPCDALVGQPEGDGGCWPLQQGDDALVEGGLGDREALAHEVPHVGQVEVPGLLLQGGE